MTKQWPVWRTMKIGTPDLRTADDFLTALKAVGCEFRYRTSDMLGHPGFAVAEMESEIELVLASVCDLGFQKGATREQINNRAHEQGLDLCPMEVGPRLRLEYKDQPPDEDLFVAMEPLGVSPRVWSVAHDRTGLWLDDWCGHPHMIWGTHFQCVFVRRKFAA